MPIYTETPNSCDICEQGLLSSFEATKKPITVSAIKYAGSIDSLKACLNFMGRCHDNDDYLVLWARYADNGIPIVTPEGTMFALSLIHI